jgi:hypothetical protein
MRKKSYVKRKERGDSTKHFGIGTFDFGLHSQHLASTVQTSRSPPKAPARSGPIGSSPLDPVLRTEIRGPFRRSHRKGPEPRFSWRWKRRGTESLGLRSREDRTSGLAGMCLQRKESKMPVVFVSSFTLKEMQNSAKFACIFSSILRHFTIEPLDREQRK